MVLYYIVLRHFAAIQTVGGKSKHARVTLFASTSPVSIWKKTMTVASTASLCLTAVHFVPSINISLLSWQAGVLRMLAVVMSVVWCRTHTHTCDMYPDSDMGCTCVCLLNLPV